MRHESARELQHFHSELEGKLSATLRIQQKEFDALSQCHAAMMKSFGIAQEAMSPLRQYPRIASFTASQLEDYVRSMEFLDVDPVKFSQAASQDQLNQLIDLSKFGRAKKAYWDFVNQISLSEIYMSKSISGDFKVISKKIIESLVAREVSMEAHDYRMGDDAWKDLSEGCNELVESITQRIRQKFFNQSEI